MIKFLEPSAVTEIIIHCSDTEPRFDLGVDDIELWHRDRGFEMIGYHFVIKVDGTIELGRPLRFQGAHCFGHNHCSVGVCYIGGRDANGRPCDTRTVAQKISLDYIISRLILPEFKSVKSIYGHSEFSTKVCPCFDVQAEYGNFISNLSKPFKN